MPSETLVQTAFLTDVSVRQPLHPASALRFCSPPLASVRFVSLFCCFGVFVLFICYFLAPVGFAFAGLRGAFALVFCLVVILSTEAICGSLTCMFCIRRACRSGYLLFRKRAVKARVAHRVRVDAFSERFDAFHGSWRSKWSAHQMFERFVCRVFMA